MLTLVPATSAHAEQMAPLLRAADVAEITIMFGPDPAEMLRHGIEQSSQAYAAVEDGVPFAIGGVVPVDMMAGTGAPWMLGTAGVGRNPRWFLNTSRERLAAAFETYAMLQNYCDPRYTASIRWLRWLGFTIGRPTLLGGYGHQFVLFSMRRP